MAAMNVTPTREQVEAGEVGAMIDAALERITGRPPVGGTGYVVVPHSTANAEGYHPVAAAFDGTIGYTPRGEYDTFRFKAVLSGLDEVKAASLADFVVRLYANEDPALDLLEELLALTEPYKAGMDGGDLRQWQGISAKAADLRAGVPVNGDDSDHI